MDLWSVNPLGGAQPTVTVSLFRIYGGIQEFLSFSLISNTVRYSYQKGYLDSHLTRRSWESRFFQFYAGDLYEVIPALAQKFYASQ